MLIKKLLSFFTKKQSHALPAAAQQGILVFAHTSDVIRAENLLKNKGFSVAVKGPPPQLRTGCDMVIVYDLMREPAIRQALESQDIAPLQSVALQSRSSKSDADALLEPVNLFHITDYGQWFMVRAANMKITYEKHTGIIVNISGGGCPDVPYLASLLMHKSIAEAEEPRLHGKTLCSYALQKAFLEARRHFLARHS